MRPIMFILIDKHPVSVADVSVWAMFMREDRAVAKTKMNGVDISTVFLGIDHAFSGEPVLFETMIFGGCHDQQQWRYVTWDEAEEGHKKAVALVEQEQHADSIISNALNKTDDDADATIE